MRHEYTAVQTRYEKITVKAEALLEMSIQYLQDMVQQADGITDDGKLYRVEEHGGSHTWFEDVPIRDATDEDRAIMQVIRILHRKNTR